MTSEGENDVNVVPLSHFLTLEKCSKVLLAATESYSRNGYKHN